MSFFIYFPSLYVFSIYDSSLFIYISFSIYCIYSFFIYVFFYINSIIICVLSLIPVYISYIYVFIAKKHYTKLVA